MLQNGLIFRAVNIIAIISLILNTLIFFLEMFIFYNSVVSDPDLLSAPFIQVWMIARAALIGLSLPGAVLIGTLLWKRRDRVSFVGLFLIICSFYSPYVFIFAPIAYIITH